MKKKKKFIALLLMICMIFVMSACGQDEGTDGSNIMQQAIENINSLKSMSAEMVIEMEMGAEGQTMEMITTMTEKIINEPILMEIDMDMDVNIAGQSQKVESKVYGEVVDGDLIVYTGMDGQWVKMTQSGMDDLQHYDNAEALKIYLEAIEDFKKVGTENINGVEADKYEGVITDKYFTDLLEQSGMDTQLGIDDIDDDVTISSLFEGVDSVPISIWISTKDIMPIKYDLDMTAMVKSMMDNLGGADLGISIDKVVTTMIITGYDAIEIPEEAKNAEEASLQ